LARSDPERRHRAADSEADGQASPRLARLYGVDVPAMSFQQHERDIHIE
jgi:hypothetical protein